MSPGERTRDNFASPNSRVGARFEEIALAATRTLGIDDLVALGVPDREMLLDPILAAKG